MKSILFFTDTHLAAETPGQRLGDYARDMLDKVAWVAELGKQYDLVCFGGDLVSAPGVSLRVVNAAVALLKDAELNLALVFGQHDLVGHSPTTVLHSAASVAYWALPDHPGVEADTRTDVAGLKLRLISHHPGIEQEITAGRYRGMVDVAVVHALVGYSVSLENVKLGAPVVLTGDFHLGYKPRRVGDTWFLNPGALARKSIDDYDRVPQVAAVQYDEKKMTVEGWEYLPVPCRPAATIFDLGRYLDRKDSEARHSEYVQLLSETAVAPQRPVEEMLDSLGVEGPVREYVEARLQEAEQQER